MERFAITAKSASFFMLISLLGLFLMLGVGLLNAVNHVSNQAEENFTTIATLHYIGIHYPEEMEGGCI